MGSMCSTCTETNYGESKPQRARNSDDDKSIMPEPRTNYAGSEYSEGKPTPQEMIDVQDLSKHESLFEDLGNFLKTLPPKSKKHIWEHGVKEKQTNGKSIVVDTAKSKEQIAKLLSDCVIVYIKYLDRKKKPLTTRKVIPYVKQCAIYIFNKYKILERHRFEQEKSYLPNMLEEYQHFVK